MTTVSREVIRLAALSGSLARCMLSVVDEAWVPGDGDAAWSESF